MNMVDTTFMVSTSLGVNCYVNMVDTNITWYQHHLGSTATWIWLIPHSWLSTSLWGQLLREYGTDTTFMVVNITWGQLLREYGWYHMSMVSTSLRVNWATWIWLIPHSWYQHQGGCQLCYVNMVDTTCQWYQHHLVVNCATWIWLIPHSWYHTSLRVNCYVNMVDTTFMVSTSLGVNCYVNMVDTTFMCHQHHLGSNC